MYQKKPGDTTFQTISVTDFTKPGVTIKVLNVYPDVGDNLKTWMETNGYGKGIIKVTPVSITSFNANPSGYMKDINGNWIYDVIMFGSWDYNNGKDLTYEASLMVEQFIKTGKGAVFGHDTVAMVPGRSPSLYHPNFARLAGYINVVNRGTYTNNMSTQVRLNKEGIFTTYPWYIGGVGTILTIPAAHTLDQTANGDIWLKFNNDIMTGNNNSYLTTWNNCAMIQTGHSSGAATADEQKILANVIFYVNQLTAETAISDYSGRDYAAPNGIKNPKYEFDNNGGFRYMFDVPLDNGTEYSYYVQAIAKDGNSSANSNIVTTTIATGIKGYSYVVDNSSTTIPDSIVDTTSNIINISGSTLDWSKPIYMHIKAIDNVGYESEVTHTLIADTIEPSITATLSPTEFTNQDVNINVNIKDLESGIKNIKLPDGTDTTALNNNYIVKENGNYTFIAYDKAGNTQTKTVNVNNIDKIPPKLQVDYSQTTGWINKDIEVIINLTDEGVSGIKNIKLPSGDYVEGGNATYIIKENGTYDFYGYDNAGNLDKVSIEIKNIDKIKPKIVLTPNITEWTNNDIEISWKITDEGGSGVKNIKLPDGTFSTATMGKYIVTENNIYNFIGYDNAGNLIEETINITNIDKTPPEIILTPTKTEFTNESFALKWSVIEEGSGIKEFVLPSGEMLKDNNGEIKIEENGTYTFICYDVVGNTSTKSIEIKNIDKIAPIITLELNTKEFTNENVKIKWKITDNLSGLRECILPNSEVSNLETGEFIVSKNGIYVFLAYDNVGNETRGIIEVKNIDKEVPTISFNIIEENENFVKIRWKAEDRLSGLKEFVLPNGRIETSYTGEITLLKSEKYVFIAFDRAGNQGIKIYTFGM